MARPKRQARTTAAARQAKRAARNDRARLRRAIAKAESILPGTPAPEGENDPRWQAIIQIAYHIESQPQPVWEFARRWGKHAQADLRDAVAVCLLEHLLEHHFRLLFPRVKEEVRKSVRFADTFSHCWWLGQAEEPENLAAAQRLKDEVRRRQR